MDFFSKDIYGNTLLKWLIAIAITVSSIFLSRLIYLFIRNVLKKRAEKTNGKLDDIVVESIEKPVVFTVVIVGIWYAALQLNLPDKLTEIGSKIYYILIIFTITWFIIKIADAIITEYIAPLFNKHENNLNSEMIPIIRKSIKMGIWGISGMIALKNSGYDVGALLAGLGIGGLAFALAAQDTISNLFGGVTVFTDKQFKVGDRIKVLGVDGVVKEIGIRSSRIQTLEGRVVIMPNGVFAKNPVENISSEPTRKVILNLGVVYTTTHSEIENCMEILKEIVYKELGTENECVVFFTNFGAYSLDLQLIYYIKKEANIPDTQSNINIQILRRFNDEKIGFAYPTQTIYCEKN
jgi:MscS family membrane protein